MSEEINENEHEAELNNIEEQSDEFHHQRDSVETITKVTECIRSGF